MSGAGGGGGVGRGPTASKQSGQCFLVINLFYSLQSGSKDPMVLLKRGGGGPIFPGGGVSKETNITCDFPGGRGGVRTP